MPRFFHRQLSCHSDILFYDLRLTNQLLNGSLIILIIIIPSSLITLRYSHVAYIIYDSFRSFTDKSALSFRE